MIAAIGEAILDFVVLLLSAVVQLCTNVLKAAITPVRYVVSSEFRGQFNARHKGRHWSYRLSAMLWGSGVLALSVPAIAFLGWFIYGAVVNAPPTKEHATAETRAGAWALRHMRAFRDRIGRNEERQ